MSNNMYYSFTQPSLLYVWETQSSRDVGKFLSLVKSADKIYIVFLFFVDIILPAPPAPILSSRPTTLAVYQIFSEVGSNNAMEDGTCSLRPSCQELYHHGDAYYLHGKIYGKHGLVYFINS